MYTTKLSCSSTHHVLPQNWIFFAHHQFDSSVKNWTRRNKMSVAPIVGRRIPYGACLFAQSFGRINNACIIIVNYYCIIFDEVVGKLHTCVVTLSLFVSILLRALDACCSFSPTALADYSCMSFGDSRETRFCKHCVSYSFLCQLKLRT